MIERKRTLNIQKSYSRLHTILGAVLCALNVERIIYFNGGFPIYPIFIIGAIVLVDWILCQHDFFQKISVLRWVRYLQLTLMSYCLVISNDVYTTLLMFCLVVLLAVEFSLLFDIRETYKAVSVIASSVLPVLCMLLVHSIRTKNIDNRLLVLSMSLLFVGIITSHNFKLLFDILDEEEKKIFAQRRYVEDANRQNQELVSNQEKVKRANEQLGYQKLQLEVAYQKINNANSEIILQNHILQQISSNHSIDQLMSVIAETIRAKMEVHIVTIILNPKALHDDKMNYKIRTLYGHGYLDLLSSCIERRCFDPYFQQKETYVDNHVDTKKYEFICQFSVGSMMLVPLQRDEEVIGGLFIGHSMYGFFNENVTFFETIASTLMIAIENANMYRQMQEMAIKDGLTGVYNRRQLTVLFEKYVYESLENRTPISVALLDIDKFKNINDSYGHAFGDKALKFVANFCDQVAKNHGGIIGRYGGEEFLVIFPNKSLEETYKIISDLHQRIKEQELVQNGDIVHIRLSVGITSYPETCKNPNNLFNRADWAMYYSKQNGRDRVTIDSDVIREKVRLK